MTNLKIGDYGVVSHPFAYTITRVPSTHLYIGQSQVRLLAYSQEGKGRERMTRKN